MTLDKQKLIEAMAQGMWGACNNEGTYILAGRRGIKTYFPKILAEAAFKALQDNLPEITLNLHEDLTLNEEKAKLWDGLKGLGR